MKVKRFNRHPRALQSRIQYFLCQGWIATQNQCGNDEKTVTTMLIVDSIMRPHYFYLPGIENQVRQDASRL